MADFLDELQEDIRQERYLALWKTYGPVLIGAICLILVGTATYVGWQAYQGSVREGHSEAYHRAVSFLKEGKVDEAVQGFQGLEMDSGGYGFLSRLQLLGISSKAFARLRSVEAFDRIKARSQGLIQRYPSRNPPKGALQGLIHTHLGLLMVEANFWDSGIQRNLDQQTAPHHPWKGISLETLLLQSLQRGDRKRAAVVLAELMGAQDIPSATRARAGLVAIGASLSLSPMHSTGK